MRMDFKNEDYYSKNAWEVEKALSRAVEVLKSFTTEYCLKDFSVVKSSSENKLGSPR